MQPFLQSHRSHDLALDPLVIHAVWRSLPEEAKHLVITIISTAIPTRRRQKQKTTSKQDYHQVAWLVSPTRPTISSDHPTEKHEQLQILKTKNISKIHSVPRIVVNDTNEIIR